MHSHNRIYLLNIILFAFFIFSSSVYADVPNAPALTAFGGKTVVSGETIYTNNNQQGVAQPAVPVAGSAPAGTEIKIYKDSVLQTQTTPTQIITASDGKWSATVTMATGTFNITATASNSSGQSLHSEAIHVVLDTTAPSISVTVRQTGWRTNQKYMYGHNNMYGNISDSGAGINWQTASISVSDLTDNEQIAGTQEHDGSNQIDFYPTAGWVVTQENTHTYRITVSVYDNAGNLGSNYREYIYDSVNPSGVTNIQIYDQGQWKNYSSGMTVYSNPPIIRGTVSPVNYKNQGPDAYCVFNYRFHPWNTSTVTTDSGRINISTGEFTYQWTESQIFQEGATSISFHTLDSAYLYVVTYISLNFSYGTPAPPPLPSLPVLSQLYNIQGEIGGERQVIGSPLIPDFSGSANQSTSEQTIRIFYAAQSGNDWLGSIYNYSIVILPAGESYTNTPGVYDPGEVYSDANDNDQYDSGEQFLDNNSKGTSDGQSYSIPNFLGNNFPHGTMYIKIAAVNQYGGSTANSLGRFHYITTPPDIQSIDIQPVKSPFLASGQIPSSITVNVQNGGYDWATFFYAINQSVSKIEVLDDTGSVVSSNATTWTYLQSLRYEGTTNVSNISFQPQKLYTVRVTARDLATNETVEDAYSFFIDTLAPQVVDIIPEPGSEIGRLPNFQATLFDTSSGDLDGSGISFGNGDQAIGDSSFSQLRPFRVIDQATASGNTLSIQGPILGYDRSNLAVVGTEFEVWQSNDSETVGTVAISSISGSTITLTPVDCTLTTGTEYTILQPIPYYHANNALDTLSANPINPILQSGYYAVQVQAVDKVGNTSVVSSVYEFGEEEPIVYNPPTGTFAMSVDKPVALAGEIITVESEEITTLNGTPVSDGTLVTVSTTFGNILNADQDQFTVGLQVTTSGGKVTFQVQSTGTGSGTVHAEVGEAYSDPDPTIEYIPNYPYGTYTLNASPSSLTADGSGVVTITGPTVTDQYGNVITDSNAPHNLFNVTAPGFSITTADASVNTGHQVTPQADGTLLITLQAGTVAQSTTFTLESVMQSGSPLSPTASGSVGLTLTPDEPASQIILTTSNDTLIAQSTETSLITSQPIKDQYNNVVPDGTLVTVSLAGEGTITSTDADGDGSNGIQRATTAGVITLTVTAQGSSVGDGVITAQSVAGTAQGTLTLHFEPDVPSGQITLTAVPSELIADGSSISNISSSVIVDQYGNSVGEGVTVTISTTTGLLRADDQSAWTADQINVLTASDGSISFDLQSTLVVEQAQVTAQTVSGSAEGSCAIDFIAGEPTGSIELSSNFDEVVAGSSEVIIITGQVKDAFDHAVANGTYITVSPDDGTVLTVDAEPLEPGIQVTTTDGSFTFRFTAEGAPVQVCDVIADSLDGDATGNIQIGFIAGPPDQLFTLMADPASILADGQTTTIVTSSVIYDAYNNIVAQGELIIVETSLGTITTADADAGTPELEIAVDGSGQITFEVQSATQSGSAQLTASSVSGTATGSGSVEFTPGIPSGTITLTATPSELIANSGQTSQIISGIIRDTNNNIVADGSLITVSTDRGELSAEDADGNDTNGIQVATTSGVISFELLSQLSTSERIEAGTATITAYGEGEVSSRAEGSTNVSYIYSDPYQPIVLSASTSPITADGQSTTTITSDPILDQYDNPMAAGVYVTVSSTLGQIVEDDLPGMLGNQVSTDADGQITFTLQSGIQAGSAVVVALSNVGSAQGQLTVPFEAGVPSGTIVLNSNPDELVLDGSSTATVTSDSITDTNGNVVTDGTLITVDTDNGYIETADEDGSIDGTQVSTIDGIITFTVSSQGGSIGTASVTAESTDQAASGSVGIDFIPGPPSGTVTLTPSPASIVADPYGLAPVNGIVTESTITSNPITDAGGNVIADGELFTVYTNRGEIISTDAAPAIGGIQIAVTGAALSFQLSSSGGATGVATVYAQSVNGTAAGSTQVTFTDTGVSAELQIVLDPDRPNSDRYVAWDTSRQVRVICTDIMGNPASADSVTLTMTQNESGAVFSQYTGYPGSGTGTSFTGTTDSDGILMVTYTTPAFTVGKVDNSEDILDAYSAQVDADDVDDRRFIVTTAVPPLFRFYSMGATVNAGEYHPFTLEIIDEYDSHISDVQTQFPTLQVLLTSDPTAHAASGDFYIYDSGSYTAIGQNTAVSLPWDASGFATVYYRDTLAGPSTITVADNQAGGIKAASRRLTVLPGLILTGAPQFSISASPTQILADGSSMSTISSEAVTDPYGNVIEGFEVTVSSDYGTLIAVDINSTISGVQVATGSDGIFSFSLRSQTDLVTATVDATTFIGGPSDSATVDFIAGAPYGTITLVPDNTEVAADPSNTVTVTSGIIYDQWGNQVATGQLVTVSTTLGTITTTDADGDGSNGTQVAVDAQGQISFTVQASTQAGSSTLSASSVNGSATGSTVINFVPGDPSGIIVLHATPSQVIANSPTSCIIVSDPITDGTNIIRDDELFTVSTDKGTLVALDQSSEDGLQVKSTNGIISFTFNPNSPKGIATIQAVSVNGTASGSVQVTMTSESRSTGTIVLNALPTSIAADGVSVSAVESDPMYDRYGNLLDAGISFTVSTSNGTINATGSQIATVSTDAAGMISFEVKSSITSGLSTTTVQCVNNPASTGSVGIMFMPGDAANTIVLQATPSTLIANSDHTSLVKIPTTSPLKDSFGNVVQDGTEVILQTGMGHFVDNGSEVTQITVTTVNGSCSATFKATEGPGTAQITATSGSASGLVSVDLIPGAPSGTITLTPDPASLVADGSSTTTITSSVITDEFGNQVSEGTLVTVTRTSGTIITPDADTNLAGRQIAVSAQGTISFDLQAPTVAATATVQAQSVTGSAQGSATVAFVPGNPAVAITLTAVPNSLIAGSEQQSTITSSVIKDANGNPVGAGVSVTVSATKGLLSGTAPSLQLITDQNSKIQVALVANSGSTVGTAQVTAQTDTGTAQTGSPLEIAFVADVPAGAITLTASPSSITADGSTTSTITSSPITDAYGNVVPQNTLVTIDTTWGSILEADVDPTGYPDHQIAVDASGVISFTVQSETVVGTADIYADTVEGSASGLTHLTGVAGSTTDLIVIMPGETFDSSQPSRKTGAPVDQTINVSFNVTVVPVDQFGNIVYNETMELTLAALSSFTACSPSFTQQFDGSTGSLVFSLEDTIAGQNLQVSVTATSPALTGTGSLFNILAGEAIKLQVILPGQTAVPGDSGDGVSGSPDAQEAGIPFDVIVNYVDQFYNVVTTSAGTIQLRSSGLDADRPGNLSLSNGTCTFVMTERTLTSSSGSLRRLNAQLIEESLSDSSDDFEVIDSSAPQVLSFTIENDAQYTTSQQVTLQIDAVDAAGADIEMQFRNEDQTWAEASAYEAYQVEKTGYTLSSGLGSKTVFVRVRDANGYVSDEYSDTIIYANPPTANAGGNYSGIEGDSITFDASGSTDPDPNETLSYDWDIDGDGQFDDAHTAQTSLQYLDNIDTTVSVRVTDQFGLTDTDTVSVTITNATPVVNSIGDVLCRVDQEITIDNITFSDAGTLDTHTASVDWNDTSSDSLDPVSAGQAFSFSHTYTQPGDYSVTVSVQDNNGATGTSSFTVQVRYSPVANAGSDYTGTENTAVIFDASGSYDSDTDDLLSYDWDLDGDGQFDDASGVSVSHTWTDDYTGTVSVRITDSYGFYDVDSASLVVYNAAPVIDTTFDDMDIEEGQTVSLNDVQFSDLGIDDTHTATIDWGYLDDQSDPVTDTITYVTSPFSIDHVFLDDSVYTVTVTVEDDDGDSDQSSFTVTVGIETITFDIVVDDEHDVLISFDPIDGKEYELFFSDSDDVLFSNSLSNWISAGIVAGGVFEDTGDADGADNIAGNADDRIHPQEVAVRYYRIVRTDEIDVHGNRCCSADIAYIRNVTLEPGRNFVGKCDNEQTLAMAFDPSFLPGGMNQSSRASVYYFSGDETYQGFVFDPQSGDPASWYDQSTLSAADLYTMSDGQGVMLTLPYTSGSIVMPKVGFIKQDTQAIMLLNTGGYAIISWPYACAVSIESTGLLESGILGGLTARRSDQLLLFDASTQQYEQPIFFCTAGDVNEWRYMDQTPCTKTIKPGQAILLKRNASSTFTQWTATKPYIDHGKTIAP